jgi:hypothetical protein
MSEFACFVVCLGSSYVACAGVNLFLADFGFACWQDPVPGFISRFLRMISFSFPTLCALCYVFTVIQLT